MVLQSKITKQHARLARNAWSLEGISSITKAKHLKWKEKKKKKPEGWGMRRKTNMSFSFFLLHFCYGCRQCFDLNSPEAYKMCLCFHTLKKWETDWTDW